VFGLLILLRLSGRINFLGGLIGAAFLLFGLYRLNFFFRNAVSHLRSAKKRDTAG
jgi:hypothetical protein